MRSSVFLPRRRVGACSPSTHLIASTTLDLPHPLGPTTAVTPGAKLMLVCSQKDLKPTSSRLLRRIYHRLRHTTLQPGNEATCYKARASSHCHKGRRRKCPQALAVVDSVAPRITD